MRVLHIIPTLASGGAEKMLVDLVCEMKKKDIECEIAVLTSKSNFFASSIEELGIPIYYGNKEKIYTIKNIRFLIKLLKNNKYDIVHTHLFSAQLFAPIAKIISRSDASLFTTEHSTHNKRRNKKVFYLIDYWLYSKYKNIIGISSAAKENLIKYLPILKDKVKVVNNGINISAYSEAIPIDRTKIIADYTENDVIITMVASLRAEKDHRTLIDASNNLPLNYKFVFVGEGPLADDLKSYCQMNSKHEFFFLGKRKDVASILKSSDIFILSSNWEGFGLVVVEAAACNLPIIASDVAGLAEVVKSLDGVLFESRNSFDLANKILDTKIEKKTYSNLEIYSIKNTAKEYIECYSK